MSLARLLGGALWTLGVGVVLVAAGLAAYVGVPDAGSLGGAVLLVVVPALVFAFPLVVGGTVALTRDHRAAAATTAALVGCVVMSAVAFVLLPWYLIGLIAVFDSPGLLVALPAAALLAVVLGRCPRPRP